MLKPQYNSITYYFCMKLNFFLNIFCFPHFFLMFFFLFLKHIIKICLNACILVCFENAIGLGFPFNLMKRVNE